MYQKSQESSHLQVGNSWDLWVLGQIEVLLCLKNTLYMATSTPSVTKRLRRITSLGPHHLEKLLQEDGAYADV